MAEVVLQRRIVVGPAPVGASLLAMAAIGGGRGIAARRGILHLVGADAAAEAIAAGDQQLAVPVVHRQPGFEADLGSDRGRGATACRQFAVGRDQRGPEAHPGTHRGVEIQRRQDRAGLRDSGVRRRGGFRGTRGAGVGAGRDQDQRDQPGNARPRPGAGRGQGMASVEHRAAVGWGKLQGAADGLQGQGATVWQDARAD
jgi:hypothetical protein